MLTYRHQAICFTLAALTGAAFASADRPAAPQRPLAIAAAKAALAPALAEDQESVARALCGLKQKIGKRKERWAPALCRALAGTVLAAAERHGLSPALLLAVMIQESDLDQDAARVSRSRGKVARDSGLMGIRCVLDGAGRCTNALVRGLPWRRVMDPHVNIELGARYLALYRNARHCRHGDHAYWAHYNHGMRYISRGQARLYPRHVAALYTALGETLKLDTSELHRVKTIISMDERSRRLVTVVGGLDG